MAKDEVEVKGKAGPSKLQGFCKFVWNSETKEFLGRTGKSWVSIIIYFMIFYACLAGFFYLNLKMFFIVRVDDKVPTRLGYDSIIKYYPGMGFRPAINSTTLIQFSTSNTASTSDALKSINDMLAPYYNTTDDNLYQDCNGNVNASNGKSCRFDLNQFGPCSAANNYGYYSGKPCVLLKLNKIYGWIPQPLQPDENSNCNKEYNDTTGKCLPLNNQHVEITCQGEVAADVDNIGPVSLYPPEGLSYLFYPYTNQQGYLAPLVMAQFENPHPGALILVWCKAWAQNIYHDRVDQAGSVHFELLVDTK